MALLVWSADKFVEGASGSARILGVPPLLIGMLIIGFGTSAPEIFVSIFSAVEGKTTLALGNAIGSNITNVGLILGITALFSPIIVSSNVLKMELPILLVSIGIAIFLMLDLDFSRFDGAILLLVFILYFMWTIWSALNVKKDALAKDVIQDMSEGQLTLGMSLFWLVTGLVFLVGSSRLLVWGAVGLAQSFGVSDLIIGLTIVAIGTSLPELAASVAAIRKQVHDLALGNILGSNLFNTLVVCGLAGVIHPTSIEPVILSRDMSTMLAFNFSILIFGHSFRGRKSVIGPWAGATLLVTYFCYNIYLVIRVV